MKAGLRVRGRRLKQAVPEEVLAAQTAQTNRRHARVLTAMGARDSLQQKLTP
jgi:hypothetical protein